MQVRTTRHTCTLFLRITSAVKNTVYRNSVSQQMPITSMNTLDFLHCHNSVMLLNPAAFSKIPQYGTENHTPYQQVAKCLQKFAAGSSWNPSDN